MIRICLKQNKQNYIVFLSGLLFILLISSVCHLLFSKLGFNPTDDGFILAYSRRILQGEIPHKDFISIRPVLSPIIHLPILIVGKQNVLIFSRFFVWLELSFISWCWIIIIERFLKLKLTVLYKIILALITFFISVNSFQIMAWHTIDGLVLITTGLLLYTSSKNNWKNLSIFIISCSYLCKQSFIFVPLAILLISDDWKKIKYWITIALPIIIYFTFSLFTNSFKDTFIQLTSKKGILTIISFFNLERKLWTGIALGFILMTIPIFEIIKSSSKYDKIKFISYFLLSFIPLIYSCTTFLNYNYPNMVDHAFLLFGFVLGIVLFSFLANDEKNAELKNIGVVLIIVAFCVSLSMGASNPALFSGTLIGFLIIFSLSLIVNNNVKIIFKTLVILFLILLSISFFNIRTNYIYREQRGEYLTERLDNVLSGANGIFTNVNTYSFLADLKKAVQISLDSNKTYSIIPDIAAYWITSKERNPLPIDWTLDVELSDDILKNTVKNKLNYLRPDNYVIIDKIDTWELQNGFTPIGNNYYIVNYVKSNFTKINETKYFEIYK